jgi:GntR family transcriptional repressor for pyruvate dehydrogenase complex
MGVKYLTICCMAADTTRWKVVRPSRASDEIVAQLRQAVFDGGLRPGDPLGSEGELATRFGVSRLSVREAMRSLEACGVIEMRLGPKGGPHVAHGDPQRFAEALAIQLRLVGVDMVEVLDALAGLEQMAARLAALHATAADIETLAGLVAPIKSEGRSLARVARAGRMFHEALAQASHNQVVIATLVAVRQAGERQQPSAPEAAHFNRFHQAIFEAIRDRQPDRAADLTYAHAVERRQNLEHKSGAARRARSS